MSGMPVERIDLDKATHIEIESGVSMFTGEPFCTVRLNGRPSGQMSPDQVRRFALQWLEAAEAAESDAIVFKVLTKEAGLEESVAGGFIRSMRQHRSDR